MVLYLSRHIRFLHASVTCVGRAQVSLPRILHRFPFHAVGADAHSAAVGGYAALRMRHTPCGCIRPRRHFDFAVGHIERRTAAGGQPLSHASRDSSPYTGEPRVLRRGGRRSILEREFEFSVRIWLQCFFCWTLCAIIALKNNSAGGKPANSNGKVTEVWD